MNLEPIPESSEFRQDQISGRWVVLAPERARRPLGLSNAKPSVRVNVERDVCPFCPGKEADTPAEVYTASVPGSTGWEVRVIPNKFPAVRPIAPDTRGLTLRMEKDLLPGFGVHEVVIEGRAHETDPTVLNDAIFQQVLLAYRERILTFSKHPRLDYVSIFKNVGAEAGASMAHLHSQLIATPFIPNDIHDELVHSERIHRDTGWCAYCRMMLGHAGRKPPRFVAESERFMAVCPFAPRFGYETWVMPKDHFSHYETIADHAALELAIFLKRIVAGIDAVAAMPAFNYYIHTAPLRAPSLPHYHWHIEIAPRTSRAAGFEWGTGVFINSVPPEKSASELRGAISAR